MTDAEVIAAAREIVAASEKQDFETVDNRSWKWGIKMAALLLAHDAALAEARAENERLKKQYDREYSDHCITVNQRDEVEKYADLLAACAGGSDVIGEHSNLNNPWENALEILSELRRHADIVASESTEMHNRNVELEADRDRLLAGLREQVRHCSGCLGSEKAGKLDKIAVKYIWAECQTCKPARDLIAEHEAKP